jgi:hypothetical protein
MTWFCIHPGWLGAVYIWKSKFSVRDTGTRTGSWCTRCPTWRISCPSTPTSSATPLSRPTTGEGGGLISQSRRKTSIAPSGHSRILPPSHDSPHLNAFVGVSLWPTPSYHFPNLHFTPAPPTSPGRPVSALLRLDVGLIARLQSRYRSLLPPPLPPATAVTTVTPAAGEQAELPTLVVTITLTNVIITPGGGEETPPVSALAHEPSAPSLSLQSSSSGVSFTDTLMPPPQLLLSRSRASGSGHCRRPAQVGLTVNSTRSDLVLHTDSVHCWRPSTIL